MGERMSTDFIELDGHRVDRRILDRFYNAADGSRVTDDQWDEEKRRREGFVPASLVVSDTPPEGSVIADA